MVVPWMAYSIWKNWVIHVLVFLVFHVFSTAELISPCKTVNLAVWAFSSIFLHDFTLFGIDMNYIYHISSIATTFGPLSKVTILGQKCMAILGIRRILICPSKGVPSSTLDPSPRMVFDPWCEPAAARHKYGEPLVATPLPRPNWQEWQRETVIGKW